VLGTRVLDIAARMRRSRRNRIAVVAMPADMRELIETTVASRRASIASPIISGREDRRLPFAFDVQKVSIKAPIKYPYNCSRRRRTIARTRTRCSAAAARQRRERIDPDKVDR